MARQPIDPVKTIYRVASYSLKAQNPSKPRSGEINEPNALQTSAPFQSFDAALDFLLKEHGDTEKSLLCSMSEPKILLKLRSVTAWRAGRSIPRSKRSYELLQRIEKHYHLKSGYFAELLSILRPTFKCNSSKSITPFQSALNFQMRLHGDSSESLAAAVKMRGEKSRGFVLTSWKTGRSVPRYTSSFDLLGRIEDRYRLADGYFSNLIEQPRSAVRNALQYVRPALRPIFFWHLPDDFELRTPTQREEIVLWIFENVLGKSTAFGRYQARATRHGFAVVFPNITRTCGGRKSTGFIKKTAPENEYRGGYGTVSAPRSLSLEMQNLISFQTNALAPSGYRRTSRWSEPMADKTVRQYGMLFGALASAPRSFAAGLGVPLAKIGFGILAFPAVIDWYLRWREHRRGFFSTTEISLLYGVKGLLQGKTGWIRQHRQLARRLRPISGMLTKAQISRARRNWSATCETALQNVLARIPELQKAARPHRDPFEAILPILEAKEPLSEYKKIADEILRLMPDSKQFPLEAAICVRAYLMLRFGMHLGIRQRNLRELLVCRIGMKATPNERLRELRCGELRWLESEKVWEVFIPSEAFKNAKSSFFRGKPFRVILLDLDNLYFWLDTYLKRDRKILLGDNPEPGAFFVKSGGVAGRQGAFGSSEFYITWRAIIRRYGIYNPYTGRGAVSGLLPHGPHNIRDVIATHVLRQTGSYELASFAIQDTVEAVTRHYTRFLPQEKSARAAEILNEVWSQH